MQVQSCGNVKNSNKGKLSHCYCKSKALVVLKNVAHID